MSQVFCRRRLPGTTDRVWVLTERELPPVEG